LSCAEIVSAALGIENPVSRSHPPVMKTITVPLADEDLAFLQRFSETQGTSVGEFLARQARSLRRQLEKPLPPEIVAATGIVESEVDSKNELMAHLLRKHR
jgi:hypothetical protein